MKSILPIYKIEHFKSIFQNQDFYANYFIPHITHHHFATSAHKHDFYLIVLFTKGSGTHEIDFNTYNVKAGAVFMMAPGQMHNWILSKDIDGYVFFHTKNFYDNTYTHARIETYPFFQSIHQPPVVYLNKEHTKKLAEQFNFLVKEYEENERFKSEKIHCLINLIYIELSRQYVTEGKVNNESYLLKIRMLEKLIDKHFKLKKHPYEYASLMNLSEKHLNRMNKNCLNKTTTELIADRIVLEAKRLLVHSKQNVSEIASELGFENNSYFSRFFKKHSRQTPTEFLNANKS
jgi:AraC-like DNA-binding protein